MRRIVVRRARPGIWAAGIEWHPNWVSFHDTWAEAMEQVSFYVAARDHEQQMADALGSAFDRLMATAAEIDRPTEGDRNA